MSIGILGKKLGMTRVFRENGESIPVCALEIGPCYIIQIKRAEKEGYNAIQLGFQPRKEKGLNRPTAGHFKAAGRGGFRVLREFRVDDPETYELGQEITSEIFNIGDRVTVSGTSKGRGFSGCGRDTGGEPYSRKRGRSRQQWRLSRVKGSRLACLIFPQESRLMRREEVRI
jgi:large subunit ribosomal protein L3